MSPGGPGYRVVPYSGARRGTAHYPGVAGRKHPVHAWRPTSRGRGAWCASTARTGEALSFIAFVIACLARAVDEDRRVRAYRLGRKRLIVFDDVDVCVLVEHEADEGPPVASPYVIRAANRRPYLEIHRELRGVQTTSPLREMQAGGRIPGFAWRWFWRVLERRPHLHRRVAGTVGVTAVGMFGRGAGWGIPISDYTLVLTVGGIAERPAFAADGAIERRESLSLTVSGDHDVVDGAPAARFIQRLEERLESGHGLDDSAPATVPDHRGRETALAGPTSRISAAASTRWRRRRRASRERPGVLGRRGAQPQAAAGGTRTSRSSAPTGACCPRRATASS